MQFSYAWPFILLMILIRAKFIVSCPRGTRGTNGLPPAASIACPDGLSKQKPDTVGNTLAFSSAVACTSPASTFHGDAGKRPALIEDIQIMNSNSKLESLQALKQHRSMDSESNPSEELATEDGTYTSLTLSSELSSPLASKDNDRGISMPPEIVNSAYQPGQSCSSVPEKPGVASDGQIHSLCTDIYSMSIDGIPRDVHSVVGRPNSSLSDPILIKAPGNQGLQQHYAEPSIATLRKASSINGVYASREHCEWKSDSPTQVTQDTSSEAEDDILSFDSQRLKDPEVLRSTYLPNSANSLHVSRSQPLQYSEDYGTPSLNADRLISVDNRVSDDSFLPSSGISMICNGFAENLVSNAAGSARTVDRTFLLQSEEKGKQMGRYLGGTANGDGSTVVDKGESSIISNILSMDSDAWDESLASPQNLAKLLSESDKQSGSSKISSSWKVPINNQSRFSFARHEESKSQLFDVQRPFNGIEQLPKSHSFGHDFVERDLYMDKLKIGNGFSSRYFEESENLANGHPFTSSNKLSGESCLVSSTLNLPSMIICCWGFGLYICSKCFVVK